MKTNWLQEELEENWTITCDEGELFQGKSTETKLSFVFMLKFYQYFGWFPKETETVSQTVVSYLSKQIGSEDSSINLGFFSNRTSKEYRQQIRKFLGFRVANKQDIISLRDWLSDKIIAEGHTCVRRLMDLAYTYLKSIKVEPFSHSRIDRCVRSAVNIVEQQLFTKVSEGISNQSCQSLDNLIVPQETQNPDICYLYQLKQDAGNVSLESILEEVEKIQRIQDIGLPEFLFNGFPAKILEKYKTRVMAESPSEIRKHPKRVKYSLLAIFCYVRSQEIIDNLVELFIQVIQKIGRNSQNRINKKLIQDLKRVTGKQTILFDLAQVAIAHPEGIIREVVYTVVNQDTLQSIIKEHHLTGASYKEQVYKVMRSSYSNHYRRMLSPLLKTLSFHSNNSSHKPVLDALELIKKYLDSKITNYPDDKNIPIKGVIKPSWEKIIIEKSIDENGSSKSGQVNRINYEIAALKALKDGLKCKEIWVKGSHQYRNPDEDLPSDFETQRQAHYTALNQPLESEAFIDALQKEMKSSLKLLNEGIPKNTHVKLLSKKGGYISLSPLEPQKPSPNLEHIKKELFDKWATTGLLDILKEADLRTGFTSLFKSTASREYMNSDDLQKRLLLCIFAFGTNTGLKRISASNPEIQYDDLRYIRRRYLTKTNVRSAITEIVNAILAERKEEFFGQSTTSFASDSTQVGVWDQNLLTEWHTRYRGRGVMIYWHIDRKSVLIYSQLKRCSSSEVSSMIEGVLRHCTNADIQKGYVDSHGQSAVGFAFSYMLGFDLLPRIKAIHKEKLYRPESGKPDDYGNLQNILTRPIRWQLIQEQYDQMIKFATALRLGTADAESILRRFTSKNAQHPVYQALIELGKAVKTIFLCRYLHSPELRREIHEGLNVIESSNSVNDFILYGKGGEISTNRREDQELTMLCLHLLQNSLVYINTLMLQSILSSAHWKNKLTDEDKRAITPLFYEHINPYGLFILDLTYRIPLDYKMEAANDSRIANAA